MHWSDVQKTPFTQNIALLSYSCIAKITRARRLLSVTQSAVLQLPPFKDAARSFLWKKTKFCFCFSLAPRRVFVRPRGPANTFFVCEAKTIFAFKRLSLHSWLQSLLCIYLSENLYSLYFLYDSARLRHCIHTRCSLCCYRRSKTRNLKIRTRTKH